MKNTSHTPGPFYDIVNGSTGWDLREAVEANSPWVVIATCPDFGTAQRIKTKMQQDAAAPETAKRLADLLAFVEEYRKELEEIRADAEFSDYPGDIEQADEDLAKWGAEIAKAKGQQ